jgi:tetratricopeptide (TPR) repeat protein
MLEQAIQLHQTGRLTEAEAAYQRILAGQPQNADALHLLGVVHLQTGRTESGIELIRRALAIQPDNPMFNNNLGKALVDAKQYEEAAERCRRAVSAAPQYVDALNNLGNALRGLRRYDDAIATFNRALQMQPSYPPLYNNLGAALRDAGKKLEAVAFFQRATAIAPQFAEAHHHLGGVLNELKRYDEAVNAFLRALQFRPDFPETHSCLGDAYFHLKKYDEARNCFERALQLDPNYADALLGKGTLLHFDENIDEAFKYFRRAIAIKPDYAAAHYSLGVALLGIGKVSEALESYKKSQACDPEYPEAHYGLAMANLLQGDLEAGWPEYEWRWKVESCVSMPRQFNQPQWDGSPLNGKTILLHAEQGFGDSIQFVRYVPMVAERGGRVIVEAPRPLLRLFSSTFPQLTWIETGAALPAFDVQCPMLSLPLAFKTTTATIPQKVPYLTAPESDVAYWRGMLSQTRRPRIGFTWAGNRNYKNDRNRSIAFETMSEMLKCGVGQFVSLQKGEPPIPAELSVIDHTPSLNDLAATAGLISTLDLVVSVDTAIGHLAGALGKPVWILLPRFPDWRWLTEGTESRWYPTARLFRQRALGTWPAVLAEVIEALRKHPFELAGR